MKNIFKLLIILAMPITVFAHSLLLNVLDNEDNTITVEGVFNTGESGAGALIQLESLNSGEILFEQRLPDESEMVIKIPEVPYKIILDGGPGHKVIKEGPAPLEGFKKIEKSEKLEKKEVKKKKNESNGKLNTEISSSKAVTVSIIVAFLLLFATIFISIKNTNRLLKEINHKK